MLILVNIFISILVALLNGEKRKIGFFWSFFFCVFYSIIIGYFIIISSELKTTPSKMITNSDKRSNFIIAILYILTGILGIIFSVKRLLNPDYLLFYETEKWPLILISMSIGFFGSSIYRIRQNSFVEHK